MKKKHEVEVRAYSSADKDGLVALWDRVFPNPSQRNDPAGVIARKSGVQPELLLVASLGGRIVGSTVAGYDGVRGWVHHVAVAPECRREKVGRMLMQRATEELRARGCVKLNLQVIRGNHAAVSFYKSLGFAIEDRVSMGLQLDDTSIPQGS